MPRGTPRSNLFRVLESPTPGLNRGRQLAGALVLLLAHRAGFAGVPRGTPAASPNGRPNIILIVLGTVRADAVGPRSNEKTNTPFLDAWGRKGIVFRKAISPVDYTSSSHFSMLTGAPPSLRGTAVDLPGLSVVSMLNDAGYDTLGLSANAAVDPGTLACASPFQTFVSSPYVTATSVSQEIFERFLLYRTGSGEHVAGQDSNLGSLLCSAEEMNVRLEAPSRFVRRVQTAEIRFSEPRGRAQLLHASQTLRALRRASRTGIPGQRRSPRRQARSRKRAAG